MMDALLQNSPSNQRNQQAKATDNSPKVALLFQGASHYWQPILSEFAQRLPNTIVFTPCWTGFLPGFENAFTVEQVGTMKILTQKDASKGYSPSVTYMSPRIIGHLLKYRPDVIFSTAFSLWTMIAVFLKPLFRWRVVVVFDGSSPGVDYAGSPLRRIQRKWIASAANAFITNNQAGKHYLTNGVGVADEKVFARPYLIPDIKTYAPNLEVAAPVTAPLQRPIFIFAGHLIPRKGIQELLEACALLNQQGYRNYTLLVVGDGSQRESLETFVAAQALTEQVVWMGFVEYEEVGSYFDQSDVFVFPTLEDVWGLVTVEAMMFGKPILCSKWAGAAEMVAEAENGHVFDPHDAEKLAQLMARFIENPALIKQMGEASTAIMTQNTPADVSVFLAQVVEEVLA